MNELDQAWSLLCIVAKKQIASSQTRDELTLACQSPAYVALKTCEQGSFYDQVQKEARDKAALYQVAP